MSPNPYIENPDCCDKCTGCSGGRVSGPCPADDCFNPDSKNCKTCEKGALEALTGKEEEDEG